MQACQWGGRLRQNGKHFVVLLFCDVLTCGTPTAVKERRSTVSRAAWLEGGCLFVDAVGALRKPVAIPRFLDMASNVGIALKT